MTVITLKKSLKALLKFVSNMPLNIQWYQI